MNKRVVGSGFYLAVALILGYIESLVPLNFGIPGIKLGIANIILLCCMYTEGFAMTITVAVLKTVILGLLFGNTVAFALSVCGGILSVITMLILKKCGAGIPAASAASATAHNIGQLFAAALLISSGAVFYYLPVLIISGIITGLITGFSAKYIIKRVGKLKLK